MRGEHECRDHDAPTCGGSSPRAWGTPIRSPGGLSLLRFIPTCVGNTRGCCNTRHIRRVHPHVRGEHAPDWLWPWLASGSSPRAWGTRTDDDVNDVAIRFIPTCVGNTRRPGRSCVISTVHPHVRGEHIKQEGDFYVCTGSSPRAWGTRYASALRVTGCRFIPTCVGNTRSEGPRSARLTVHPHVRGEHVLP